MNGGSSTLISHQAGSLVGQGRRLACLCVCLLVVWGLSACGAHRAPSGSPTKTRVAAKKILESAYSQIGAHYRLGGDGPGKGFDCSGFVQWAYKQQGIAVPRISAEQARTGRLVEPHEGLQLADILIFQNGQGPRGLHTGLYAGDGRFIHSPRKGQRVRTESLEVAYWKKSLIGARRLLQ